MNEYVGEFDFMHPFHVSMDIIKELQLDVFHLFQIDLSAHNVASFLVSNVCIIFSRSVPRVFQPKASSRLVSKTTRWLEVASGSPVINGQFPNSASTAAKLRRVDSQFLSAML